MTAGVLFVLPSRAMASQSRLCLICGSVLGSDAERTEHQAAEHPGMRVAWHEKRPWIVDANGTETRVGSSALKRMRGNARKVAAGVVSLRKDTPEPAPMVGVPVAGPDVYFRQVQPERFAIGGEPIGPAPTDGADPTPATDQTPPELAKPSRESLRLELGQPMLAEILRNLSVILSDWDDAGPAGHFSHTEAAQLAMLLHEPTLDAVDRFFGGDVNRFRLAMAAVVILLGKGRVHARAIQAKRLAAVSEVATDEYVDQLAAQSAPAAAVEVAPDALDPIAVLARRQQAARTAGAFA